MPSITGLSRPVNLGDAGSGMLVRRGLGVVPGPGNRNLVVAAPASIVDQNLYDVPRHAHCIAPFVSHVSRHHGHLHGGRSVADIFELTVRNPSI